MSYKTSRKTEAKKGPVDKIRVNGVTATVWENATENGPRHNVTFERSYRDDAGKWQISDSYNLSGLLALRAVTDQAISRLIEAQSGSDE